MPDANAAVTTVIWDFGGVFTTSPFESFHRYEDEAGVPRDTIRTINATNPDDNAWAKMERSEVDVDAFADLFAAEAAALGHTLDGHRVLACLSGDVRPEMVAALDGCIAGGLRVACITNNVANAGEGPAMSRSADQAEQVAEVMARFELVVESSKIGLRKPDPRIYEHACETLGVSPAACVYLDDLGINCKPAAALGMTAIKVVTPDQAIDDLERATGLRLR